MARPRKVSDETVEAIIQRRKEWKNAVRKSRAKAVAKEFGIGESTVRAIFTHGHYFRVKSPISGRTSPPNGRANASRSDTDSAS